VFCLQTNNAHPPSPLAEATGSGGPNCHGDFPAVDRGESGGEPPVARWTAPAVIREPDS